MSEDAASPPPEGAECKAQLRALADGNLDRWPGLANDCTLTHASEELGPPVGAERAGTLGGSPTSYFHYGPAPGAPNGLDIWHAGARLVFVRIVDAQPREDVEALLGQPEAILPSKMRRSLVQRAYPSRGLTLHVHRATNEIAYLMAYPPVTPEAYQASWIARLELQRSPREP